MFGRKNKNQPEQGSDRRRVNRSGGASPAFSYYTSRTPDVSRERLQTRQDRQEQTESGKSGGASPRKAFTALPFWLFIALVVVCGGKVLWLSSSPKITVVGKSSVSANYLQSSDVYATAAQKLLASSILNHSKVTANLGGTAQALQREFPELQTVSLGVPLISSRPIVYIQLAQPSLVLQAPHGNYALNGSGVVLARLQSVPAGIPVVVDQSSVSPQPGKQYLPSSTVSFVRTVAYQLGAAHLTINTFVLPVPTPYELDVHLVDKPYMIRLNFEADALTQSGAAIATIQQLGTTVPASYVDVRVPGRVYYK